MLSRIVLLAIGGYQRWLSPRKGWGCAYRLAHGGPGCSGFAQLAIREHGALPALPLIRLRFRQCHEAALLLRQDPEDRRGPLGRWCDRWCSVPGSDWGACCRALNRDASDPGGCDCTPNGCDCTPGGCGD